jgi:DNA-binding IscR family transcriptional regulator
VEREEIRLSYKEIVINLAMLEAEETMRNVLRNKSLTWLNEELDRVLTPQSRKDTREYFANSNHV